MRKLWCCIANIIFLMGLLTGCMGVPPKDNNSNISRTENIYATALQYTAEYEGAKSYIEIAKRSAF